MIPYARQHVDELDEAAVLEVLRSDFLTQGPAVERFEAAVAARAGARHAVAVANGTAALHVAMCALGIGPGDRVWTSPNSFVASANCARFCGAEVDFVDVDERTYNLSAAALERKLAQAARAGTLPRAVIPVLFAGQPYEMAAVKALAERYGFAVVADAAHAFGGTYRDLPVGAARYVDLATFSFHPVKIVTTGEGGAVVTDDPSLAEKLARFRSHGVSRDGAALERPDEGGWYYEMDRLGFNYRLTDLQAALGSAQVARLDTFLARRRALAQRYDAALGALPVTRPWQDPDGCSAFHLYPIVVPGGAPVRRRVYDALHRAGVRVNVHYIPIHLQPYYRRLGFAPGAFPNAERYYAGALSLPMFYDLSDAQLERVVAELAAALAETGALAQ
jgi:UDP-4-amino-4,6-dideoxy-N-acetyl-beta-L-altrosamine transaminase